KIVACWWIASNKSDKATASKPDMNSMVLNSKAANIVIFSSLKALLIFWVIDQAINPILVVLLVCNQ
ncbi:MAG TPA: hypothetical protein VLA25_06910, partial [Methylotenera sp.]|nr:hypothetical protein [Methylotenera sp.]